MGVPGFTLTPPVLRKDEVPILIDPAEAAKLPQLGVLSALAHLIVIAGTLLALRLSLL